MSKYSWNHPESRSHLLLRNAKKYLIQNSIFFPIDKKDSHKLFEPKEKTNFIVGNWSRYCTVTENTNFRKIWIGIKWNGTKFLRESDNQPITWANFKHSDNYVDEIGIHGCKYQTRWLRSKLIKGKILRRYFHSSWNLCKFIDGIFFSLGNNWVFFL